MERVAAELVVEHLDLDIGRGSAPVSLHAVPRYRLSEGRVVALDDRLDAVRSRVTRLSGGAELLAAAADLAVVVGGDDGRLIIDVAEHDPDHLADRQRGQRDGRGTGPPAGDRAGDRDTYLGGGDLRGERPATPPSGPSTSDSRVTASGS